MINFNTPGGLDAAEYRYYIEKTVIPYLTQMIPSTSILVWSFDGDGWKPEPPEPPVPPEEIPVTIIGTFIQQG